MKPWPVTATLVVRKVCNTFLLCLCIIYICKWMPTRGKKDLLMHFIGQSTKGIQKSQQRHIKIYVSECFLGCTLRRIQLSLKNCYPPPIQELFCTTFHFVLICQFHFRRNNAHIFLCNASPFRKRLGSIGIKRWSMYNNASKRLTKESNLKGKINRQKMNSINLQPSNA